MVHHVTKDCKKRHSACGGDVYSISSVSDVQWSGVSIWQGLAIRYYSEDVDVGVVNAKIKGEKIAI